MRQVDVASIQAWSSIKACLEESIETKRKTLWLVLDDIANSAKLIIDSLMRGGKVVFLGNGGSAADAQHLAADLVGNFTRDRQAIPAIALTTDTSILTAVGNDMGFEQVFARQIEALVDQRDAVVAISTSGTSLNVIRAARAAKAKGARVIGLTGCSGGELAAICDVVIRVPSAKTARIQEAHIAIGHAICELVESWWANAKGSVS
jgi:D-sedoheptulose 7-phosphate isomerase